MRYYVIAGEKSGDSYGGQLIQAMQKEDPAAVFRCWGGEEMQKAGGKVVVAYQDLAFMGLDFLSRLLTFRRYIRYTKKDLLTFQPHAVILIDYAGLNLRIARFAKKQGIKTFYYISPKIWAWHTSRIHQIKAHVDRMFTIFPFETDFYAQHGYAATYVGNPLLEQHRLHQPNVNFNLSHHLDNRPIIALLPGSRMHEIKRILPVMLAIIPYFPNYQFIIAALSTIPQAWYASANKTPHAKLIYDQTQDILAQAHTAVVASGTATLETAFFQVPQVVVYQTHPLTYILAKLLVHTKHIALVNIMADQEIVPELIQYQLTTAQLTKTLATLLHDAQTRQTQLAGYEAIKQLLGNKAASQTTAQLIVEELNRTVDELTGPCGTLNDFIKK